MPKQILLVDDSLTIHRVVEITFAREDYKVTAIKSGDEAISRAKDLHPDLVLADANMPGKSGYDVCAALKADPATAQVPCLILTGNFSPYDEVKGGKAGADGFVVKPFETQALIDKVADAIKKGAKGAGASAAAPAPAPAPHAPVVPQPMAAKPPVPTARPMNIEPLSKPLSVVAAETSAEMAKPAIPQPKPAPAPPPALGARTMMGFPAVTPSTPPPPTPPVKPAPPAVVAVPVPVPAPPPPIIVQPKAPAPAPTQPTIPSNVPQMPRPSMIPHVPTPQAAAPAAAPRPAAPQPRATLMGIPTVNPNSVPPGAVALPPTSQKPAAPWAPPPAGAVAPPHAAPPPSAPMAQMVSAVADRAQSDIAARGPEYEAIARLSREVIEQIAWEVVPELAETIIREQLDRLVKERA